MAGTRRKLIHSTRPDVEPLSLNDIRFCQHFAQHGNATAAYKLAGYHNSNASESAVGKAAWARVRNRKIREYVRQIREQAADAARVTVEWLAQGFRAVAVADRTAIFKADGTMKPPHTWPAPLRAIVTGVEVIPDENGVRYKVKFERSMEARKVLAQWRGMIGADATTGTAAPNPLVVGGEASPDTL